MLAPQFTMLDALQIRIIAFFCCFALLSGCTALMKPVRNVAHLKGETTLIVSIDPAVNGDAPIAVDVVTVHGSSTLKDVSKLTAQAWFQQRTTLLRMHPSDLHLTSWEWVPGQQVAPVRVLNTAVADGVVLFANYSTSGGHSVVLPLSGTVTIDFGPKDFKLSPESLTSIASPERFLCLLLP
jgi:type VI secretion system protein